MLRNSKVSRFPAADARIRESMREAGNFDRLDRISFLPETPPGVRTAEPGMACRLLVPAAPHCMETPMRTVHLLFAAIAWAGSAFAAGTSADREFAMKAAHDGANEVVLGRLASEQGQSQAVKSFGQHMVDDHTRAGEELKAAAQKDGIDLPDDTGTKAPGSERLAKLHGADFDRAYAKQMVQDHEKAVALFRRQAQSDGQSNVKAFAQKTLPTLEEHLRMARELPSQGKSAEMQESGMKRHRGGDGER